MRASRQIGAHISRVGHIPIPVVMHTEAARAEIEAVIASLEALTAVLAAAGEHGVNPLFGACRHCRSHRTARRRVRYHEVTGALTRRTYSSLYTLLCFFQYLSLLAVLVRLLVDDEEEIIPWQHVSGGLLTRRLCILGLCVLDLKT